VHTSHGFSFYRAAAYVFISSWLWRRPVVVHVHGSSFEEFVDDASLPVRLLQRTVFTAAAAVIVLSEGWADVLAQRTDSEKIHVIPNAVDPSAFGPATTESSPTIAFVSDLLERKGVHELVAALDRLSERVDERFTVDIAGRGPLQEDVQSFAAEHEHVHYHGYVSEAEKRRLLDEATIFVLPTHAEGLPFALLEAMAGSNAVVTTTVGSIPETLSADHGILVEPGDVGRLTDALETLVTDPETVAEAGRRSRSLIRESYAWAAVAEQLLACYDEVLARHESDKQAARPRERDEHQPPVQ
jgi:glycosyltransferase involved in cell wall biosynthesis